VAKIKDLLAWKWLKISQKIKVGRIRYFCCMANPVNNILSNDSVTIDLNILYEMSGGDAGIIQAIIGMYITDMPNTIQEMKEALAIRDWDTFSKKAHFAKSSLSVVMVKELHALALKMEIDTKTRTNLESVAEDLKEFITGFDASIILLNNLKL